MGSFTQSERFLSIGDFSIGKDTFLLTRFEGTEEVSGLFEFRISVLSENLDVKPEDVVGKQTTVSLASKIGRTFNGYVKSFGFGEIQGDNLREYHMAMVPWLWFLTQTNNHRVFQEADTKEIVSTIFDRLGFSDYEFRSGAGRTREYCVQHNESDFNFISRLLEDDGISYFFTHDQDKHLLVLSDRKNAYEELPETNLEYSKGSSPSAQISAWEHSYRFKKGQWSLRDYNFKEPKKDLSSTARTRSSFANNEAYEHYEYPAIYDPDVGDDLVKIRLEAEDSDRDCVRGTSSCASFQAGGRFRLSKHTNADERGDYILIEVKHKASDRSYFTGQAGNSEYLNEFVAVPADVHFRPKLLHPKPYMRGPQSAVVVGPEGEEIYTDEHGRIKVQFIWDREGKHNENSSCFVRVVQSWAGNQWGASFTPRIGHEVIVNFLDGDPDRPLVTGSVYNGWNKPVYSSKTQSGIKTRSTKEANSQNYNELRFEDKKGDEQILIHAEKNFDIEVENDQSVTVDNDRTKVVANNETANIGKDRSKSVGNNQTESIGKNKSIDVGHDHTESIANNMTLSVGKTKSVDVGNDHTESVKNNMKIRIGADLKESVGGKYTETVTEGYSLQAKTITMQASEQITLKAGTASIVMKSNGDITISGGKINVKASGNVAIKGSKVTTN